MAMTIQLAIDVGQLSFITFLKIAGPMLIASMIVGIAVSLFQSMTQINEMSMTFVPKIITVLAVIVLTAPWIVATMTSFAREMLFVIPSSLQM